MEILSTLGFDAQIRKADGTSGTLPKSTLSVAPVVQNGKAENLPPVTPGVLWLVNAAVFAATPERSDLVMFDPAATIRDGEGKAIAQGGYLTRTGKGKF